MCPLANFVAWKYEATFDSGHVHFALKRESNEREQYMRMYGIGIAGESSNLIDNNSIQLVARNKSRVGDRHHCNPHALTASISH